MVKTQESGFWEENTGNPPFPVFSSQNPLFCGLTMEVSTWLGGTPGRTVLLVVSKRFSVKSPTSWACLQRCSNKNKEVWSIFLHLPPNGAHSQYTGLAPPLLDSSLYGIRSPCWKTNSERTTGPILMKIELHSPQTWYFAKKNIREGCTACPTTQPGIIDFVQRWPRLISAWIPSVFLPKSTFLCFDHGSFDLVGRHYRSYGIASCF